MEGAADVLSLNKIFAHAGRDLLIRELALDSRNVRAGDLFLAVPGGKFDGRAHIADALRAARPPWPMKWKAPPCCRSPKCR
jgi:UDP-N-acetylmuramyl pentapeptide synthase